VNQIPDLKILIVEDDPTSEMIISRAVRSVSKEIINVRNGLDAVETCQKMPDIDLILMDIQLPYLDGYEATRQIRQFNKSVIIIAQTAYALTGDKEKSIEAGCNDYISKPINKDFLLMLIKKQFDTQTKTDD
jgi:CheY-like chemotaxis protein